MARSLSMTRKGAPALMIAVGKKLGETPDDGPEVSGSDESHDEHDIAVCPACGCTFNDLTGKVLSEDHPQHPGNSGTPSDGGSGGDESGTSGGTD